MRYCLFLILTLSTACSVDRSTHGGNKATCAAGRETCACYGNATCDGDLACVSNVCVDLGSSAGVSGGKAGSTAFAGASGAAAGSDADEDGGFGAETDSGPTAAEDGGADATVVSYAHTLLVGVWSVTPSCSVAGQQAQMTFTIDANYNINGVKTQGWVGDVLYGAGNDMFYLTGPDSFEGKVNSLNGMTQMWYSCTYIGVRKQ